MKNLLEKILWRSFCYVANRPAAVMKRFGEEAFLKNVMDPSFEWKKYSKDYVSYFMKYGFKISRMECEYFSQASGIVSDYYLPYTLWQYFIYPYLNRAEWRYAYTDKNMFGRILDFRNVEKEFDVRMPETIVSNINGIFLHDNKIIDKEKAISIVREYPSDMIIKPTVESCQGHGVAKIKACDNTNELISRFFQQYKKNYIIQSAVVQHPDLQAFNESSVNTVRLTTYRDFNGRIKMVQLLQRFGGKGKVFDNVSAGGGFCSIHSDGTYDRTVHYFHTLRTKQLEETLPQKLPYFDKILSACLNLHNQLSMFDIVAWDMSVSPDGHPYLIEYNFCPSYELQMACGPLFDKEDLDNIMEQVKNYTISNEFKAVVRFPEKPGFYYRR